MKKVAEKVEIIMLDRFGRNIDYVRISLTDRCNLSCVYCMPKGVPIKFLDMSELLSIDEIYYICEILSDLGIKKIKLTGGEPLLRHDIIDVIQKIRSIKNIEKITLTTNGVLLNRYFDRLYENGIRDINMSLDSLNPQKYEQITNFKLDNIIKNLNHIISYKDMNIKINVVPINTQIDDILALVELSKNTDIKVRFIEMMPIGYGNNFEFLSNEKILEIISNKYGNYTKSEKVHGNGPATYFSFENFKSDIGLISAVSHMFCDSCNRIRITCDGKLKPCLDYDSTLDIKELINQNINQQDLKEKIKNVIVNKPQSHNFLKNIITDKNNMLIKKDTRKMYQIGG